MAQDSILKTQIFKKLLYSLLLFGLVSGQDDGSGDDGSGSGSGSGSGE